MYNLSQEVATVPTEVNSFWKVLGYVVQAAPRSTSHPVVWSVVVWILWIVAQAFINLVSVFFVGIVSVLPNIQNPSLFRVIVNSVELREKGEKESRIKLVDNHFAEMMKYAGIHMGLFITLHLVQVVVPVAYQLPAISFILGTIGQVYLIDDFILRAKNWTSSGRAVFMLGTPLLLTHYSIYALTS